MFTQGPWRIIPGDSVVHVVAETDTVCATNRKRYYERADATDIANAHLIAAAPDMLAALSTVGLVLSERPATQKDDELWAAYSQVVAAIAKATSP